MWPMLSGWLGVSFLVGILTHSLWPYHPFPYWIVLFGFFFAILFILFFSSAFHRSWFTFGFCLLFFILGIWRFELEQPMLPKQLVPFSPKGLAYARTGMQSSFWLLRGRNALTQQIRRFFPGDEGALLAGVLYGERAMSKQAKEDFKQAGLLHIIAVSGSNVTIVATIVMGCLLRFSFTRRLAFVLFSFVLLVFILFVQPSASVVRAGIMGWLIQLAPVVGRLYRPSRLLLVAAVVFTVWKPWALIYDAGFALSFLAMAGLMTYGKWFADRLRTRVPWEVLRETLAGTFGATIMTIPYSAWAFGQVSAWALFTGLLVLPLIPWLMGSAFIALMIPFPWMIEIVRGFLKIVLFIATAPRVFGFGFWKNVWISWQMMIGLYVFLFFIWQQLRNKTSYPQKNNARV